MGANIARGAKMILGIVSGCGVVLTVAMQVHGLVASGFWEHINPWHALAWLSFGGLFAFVVLVCVDGLISRFTALAVASEKRAAELAIEIEGVNKSLTIQLATIHAMIGDRDKEFHEFRDRTVNFMNEKLIEKRQA